MATSVKAFPATGVQSTDHSSRWQLWLLLGFCLLLFFFKLGSYPLFDLDEPRYAEAGREMLEKGNWITPYFNYELRFDKPVFFYWLVAFAYKLFGLSEFSARFFSAVSATLTVGMTYAFGRQLVSRQYGFFSALILGSSVLFIGIARMSITDMTLACLMTATSLCLFLAAHKDLRWWLAAGAIAGLGVLTKGPVAIVVPGAIFTLYAWVTGQFKRCLLNRWLPLALLICLAIALPWYIAAYRENGSIFLEALFLHNITRYSDVVSGHKQPPYFYGLVLVAGFLPWTLYLPAAVRSLWERFRANHHTLVAVQDFSYLVPLYAAVWISFVFVFFSLGSTKLLTYILPLFPALALLTASAWSQVAQPRSEQDSRLLTWLRVPAWAFPVGILAGGLVFVTRMDQLLPREAAGVQGNLFNVAAVGIMLAGALLAAILLQKKKPALALQAQALTIVALVVIAIQGIVPNVSRASQGVMMEYLHRSNGQPLMLYEIQRPSLTFYGRRHVSRFVEEQRDALLQQLNRNIHTYVITKSEYLPQFQQLMPASLQVAVVEKGPVYSLLSVRKAP